MADLRPHLSGDLSERDLDLYVATVSSAHMVRGPGHFWAVAREVSVAAASYDGRMILHLTYDELKVSTGTARKIADARMAEVRQATRLAEEVA